MYVRGLGLVRPRGTRRCRERGAAAVEFALILPILVALVLGTIQFGWYFYAANSASSAAREGARRVVVGDCWGADFFPFVRDQAPTITSASYTPDPLDAADVGDIVEVTVKADGGIIDFIPMPSGGEVVRVFEARLEDDVASGGC